MFSEKNSLRRYGMLKGAGWIYTVRQQERGQNEGSGDDIFDLEPSEAQKRAEIMEEMNSKCQRTKLRNFVERGIRNDHHTLQRTT